MAEGPVKRGGGALVRIGLPAMLAGAMLAGGGWLLASQQSAEAASGKAGVRPAVAATKYDRVTDSGNVFYKVPAGYVAVKQKGGVIMVPRAEIAAGEINGYLILTDGIVLNADMRARLKANDKKAAVHALAIAAGNLADDPGARLAEPELVNDPAGDGYEAYLLASKSVDKDAGKQRFTQYLIVLVGDRAEIAMRIAYGSLDGLVPLTDGFKSLSDSMEFRNAGAPPPSRLAPPLTTDVAAITPKQEASSQSSARQASAPGERIKAGPGEVCGVEQRPRTRFNNLFTGGGTTSIYYVPVYVCRKK
jgi:hypothetical protein